MLGQAAFTWRTLTQWWESERAGRTVVPRRFWTWSILGALLTLVYALGRRDAVFALGALATGSIFVRSAWLDARAEVRTGTTHPSPWPLVAGFLVFAGLAAWGLFDVDLPVPWIVVGFVGQLAWSGRFVAQWHASEGVGRSVLPPSFFQLGLFGSVLLTAYAAAQSDWVNVAAHGLCPIPYARNLWIVRRGSAGTSPELSPDRR